MPRENDFIKDNEDDNLQDLANKFKLKLKMPSFGSVAYSRIVEACKKYATLVEYQHKIKDEKMMTDSEKRRRSSHNELCIMLLGTDWHETDSDDRRRVGSFAVSVAGKDEYIGTF